MIFFVICSNISFVAYSAEFGNVSCHPLAPLVEIQNLAKREMNLLEDVSDPTDFEDVALRALDMAIRCPVCKEVVNNPAMTPCGHSFCSLVGS
jgi:RING-type zinc-finger